MKKCAVCHQNVDRETYSAHLAQCLAGNFQRETRSTNGNFLSFSVCRLAVDTKFISYCFLTQGTKRSRLMSFSVRFVKKISPNWERRNVLGT